MAPFASFATEHTVSTVCPLDCPDSCSLDVAVQDGRVTVDRRLDAEPGDRRLHLREGPALSRAGVRRRSTALPGGAEGTEGRLASSSASHGTRRSPLIAERLHEARERWGGESILPYSYGGSNGLLTQDTSDATLFRRLGASRLARTVCAAPTGAANLALYGKMPSVAYEDFPEARLIVLWGVESVGVRHPPRSVHPRGAAPRRDARRGRSADDAAGQAGGPPPGRAARHRPARGARDPPLSLRGGPRGRSVPRRAHARRRAAAREGARRGPSSARPPKPASPPTTCGAFAELYAATSPALIRCGWGQERNRNGGNASPGDPGAAGGRRQVRRPRRRLHDEQLRLVGHHAHVDRRRRAGARGSST